MADDHKFSTKVNKKTSVKKPTKLTIKRQAHKFICEWERGEAYEYDQVFQIKLDFTPNPPTNTRNLEWNFQKYTSYSSGKTLKKVTVPLFINYIYPHSPYKLKSFSFRVAGKGYTSDGKDDHYYLTDDTSMHTNKDYYKKSGSSYKKLSANDKKNIKKKSKSDEKNAMKKLYERYYVKIEKWSDYSTKTLTLEDPAIPAASASWGGEENSNVTTFSFSTNDNTANKPYDCMDIYTALSSQTDSNKITNWTAVKTWHTGNSWSIAQAENNLNFASITRHYKAVAFGMRGKSAPAYAAHTYAAPNAVKNLKVDASVNQNASITVKTTFDSSFTSARPVSKIEIQYQVASSTPVTDGGWNVGVTHTPTSNSSKTNQSAAPFIIDSLLPQNKFLYVRAVTKYGTYNVATSAQKITGIGEALSAPTFGDIQPGADQTYTYNIPVTSTTTDVGGSKIAIYYMDDGTKYNKKVLWVGSAETSSRTVNLQLPKYTTLTPIRFGMYTFIGSYSAGAKETVVPGREVQVYNVSAELKSENVETDTLYNNPDSTIVPLAPKITGGTYNPDKNAYTIYWESTKFAEEQGTQVLWADEKDALESTKQPSSYEISTITQNSLTIKDLENCKDYFVWVRSFATVGNNKLYSAYSKVVEFDTYKQPDIPKLTVTSETVALDSIVSTRWNFNNPDGTAQASAIIEEVTEDGTVINKIGTVGEEQYFDFSPKDIGWKYDSTHWLLLTVVGQKYSRKAEELAVIHVAPELKIDIPQTSLISDYIGYDYSGTNITVDSDDGDEYITGLNAEFPYNANGYDDITITNSYSINDQDSTETYSYTNLGFPDVSDLQKFYGGSINFLTGRIEYKYNNVGDEPSINSSTLPYEFYWGSAVVFNNKLHILGSSYSGNETKHYSYDGTAWAEESTLPYEFNRSSVIVFNNRIHILGSHSTGDKTKHYSYDGATWIQESTLPYEFDDGSAVVFNNKIHILGSRSTGDQTKHYSYDGTAWAEESTLPYTFYWGSAVVFNNKIHILGSISLENDTKHYSYDGTAWAEESTLPYAFYDGAAVVFNNKLHILGSHSTGDKTKHYSYDGTIWIVESTLPYEFSSGSAVVFNDKIHILGPSYEGDETKHYSYDGTTWAEESTLPYAFYDGAAVVFNNKLHILGSSYEGNDTKHYSYDGTSWTEESTLPYAFYYGSAVVFNNKIHILGTSAARNRTKHYSYDGTAWVEESTLPYTFYNGSAVVFNNKLHILGSSYSGNETKHYSYDGTSWAEESTLPYEFDDGSAVVFNNKIHILGTGANRRKHYSYDGTTWAEESTLPYAFYDGAAVVFNNKIHILGSYSIGDLTKHYSYDGTTWAKESTLPYTFYNGAAAVFNNKMHILGGDSSSGMVNHYSISPSWQLVMVTNNIFYINSFNPTIYIGENTFSINAGFMTMRTNESLKTMTLEGSLVNQVDPLIVKAGVLREMPLWADVASLVQKPDITDTISLSIIRVDNYSMIRPDDEDAIEFSGEIVYNNTSVGYGRKTIDQPALLDVLDDGTRYLIVATVKDNVGQVANAYYAFLVRWEHQAVAPEAAIALDDDYDVMKIDIIKPEGASDTDRVDIYRLSSGKPKLIYRNAEFGQTYVDPYPTIGERGGYRVVTVTSNGDYISPGNYPAWTDYSMYIDTKFQLINFNGMEVPLQYNVSIDNNWNKDFTETKYLGGAIQGDWHVGTHMTTSLSGNVFDDLDPGYYDIFRALGDYSGPCNVRTIDGSNFTANINVGDSSTFNSLEHQHDISLDITRVDSPDMDAMTLSEWEGTRE